MNNPVSYNNFLNSKFELVIGNNNPIELGCRLGPFPSSYNGLSELATSTLGGISWDRYHFKILGWRKETRIQNN